MRNASLRSATLNVVLGERMAEHLKGQGIAPERIAIIHNWAEAEIRPVEVKENPLRAEWGLTDKLVIGYSGNMGRAHEFETILQAMALLKGKGREGKENGEMTEIEFLFIGSGHYRPWLEQQASVTAHK